MIYFFFFFKNSRCTLLSLFCSCMMKWWSRCTCSVPCLSRRCYCLHLNILFPVGINSFRCRFWMKCFLCSLTWTICKYSAFLIWYKALCTCRVRFSANINLISPKGACESGQRFFFLIVTLVLLTSFKLFHVSSKCHPSVRFIQTARRRICDHSRVVQQFIVASHSGARMFRLHKIQCTHYPEVKQIYNAFTHHTFTVLPNVTTCQCFGKNIISSFFFTMCFTSCLMKAPNLTDVNLPPLSTSKC